MDESSTNLTPTQEALQAQLLALVQDMQDLKRASRAVQGSQQKGHGYYRESYALQLEPTLRAMYEDKQPRMFRLDTMGGMTATAAYQKLAYSLLYYKREMLSKFEKSEPSFHKFVLSLKFRTILRGFVLYTQDTLVQVEPEVYKGELNMLDWRGRVLNFLENTPPNEPLNVVNLELTDSEVAYVQGLFEEYPYLVSKVTKKEIHAVKMIKEEYERACS